MPSEISITSPPGPFHRGAKADFEAVIVGQAGPFSYRWGHLVGPCPAKLDTVPLSNEGTGSAKFSLTPGTTELGALCIWVQTDDDHGAHLVAQAEITVQDRPAVVTLAQVSPAPSAALPLGTRVVVGATVKDPDNDEIPAFSLVLHRPNGDEAPFDQCEVEETSSTKQRCFVVTVPGLWAVALKWQNQSLSPVSEQKLDVRAADDQPPCLTALPDSSVIVQEASKILKLEVSVRDDLDAAPSALPGSMAVFRWSVAERPGSPFLAASDYTERFFSLVDGRYSVGDELRVRVDVADRVDRVSTCKPTDDTCGTGSCLQRMTWRVQFQ